MLEGHPEPFHLYLEKIPEMVHATNLPPRLSLAAGAAWRREHLTWAPTKQCPCLCAQLDISRQGTGGEGRQRSQLNQAVPASQFHCWEPAKHNSNHLWKLLGGRCCSASWLQGATKTWHWIIQETGSARDPQRHQLRSRRGKRSTNAWFLWRAIIFKPF